jgi:hypothetical protein
MIFWIILVNHWTEALFEAMSILNGTVVSEYNPLQSQQRWNHLSSYVTFAAYTAGTIQGNF